MSGPKKAMLALACGEVFEGTAVGAEGETVGEVVFNTSHTGYQEILTDPSYAGQLVTFTVSGGAGTFTLTFNGQTTTSLAFNATAAPTEINVINDLSPAHASATFSTRYFKPLTMISLVPSRYDSTPRRLSTLIAAAAANC